MEQFGAFLSQFFPVVILGFMGVIFFSIGLGLLIARSRNGNGSQMGGMASHHQAMRKSMGKEIDRNPKLNKMLKDFEQQSNRGMPAQNAEGKMVFLFVGSLFSVIGAIMLAATYFVYMALDSAGLGV